MAKCGCHGMLDHSTIAMAHGYIEGATKSCWNVYLSVSLEEKRQSSAHIAAFFVAGKSFYSVSDRIDQRIEWDR